MRSSRTSEGLDTRHARPIKVLFLSMIGSAVKNFILSGISFCDLMSRSMCPGRSFELGLTIASSTCAARISFCSPRMISFVLSSISRSLYHTLHCSNAFCTPSNTQTVSGVNSTPLIEMNVRSIDPKRPASAPKAPMYRERSCNCGGEDAGYVAGRETKNLMATSS